MQFRLISGKGWVIDMGHWKRPLIITGVMLLAGFRPAFGGDMEYKPRVPADSLASVKEMANPVSDKGAQRGKEVFLGKARCYNCHGMSGKGDGPAGAAFNPKPRDFTDPQWQKARTDGEIFWAISNGTEFGMIPYGGMLSEEERWQIVNYIREIGGIPANRAD
ncbi:MAG: cytochrome c [Deltaproteobacteria bacterium]|nr:cytochrome c [Deltaproteobacteria bacterium]